MAFLAEATGHRSLAGWRFPTLGGPLGQALFELLDAPVEIDEMLAHAVERLTEVGHNLLAQVDLSGGVPVQVAHEVTEFLFDSPSLGFFRHLSSPLSSKSSNRTDMCGS